MWSIPVSELDKANKDLGYRTSPYSKQALNPQILKKMVMDVYYHPSKHVEIINELMQSRAC
jgi:hypothetical protein